MSPRADLRSAYLYLVCLVALVLAIFAAVSLVRNAVQWAYPDTAAYGIEPAYPPGGTPTSVTDADRARRERLARESQRHQAGVGMVGSGAMLVIAGPVYLYHWRRVQAEQPTRRSDLEGPSADPDR